MQKQLLLFQDPPEEIRERRMDLIEEKQKKVIRKQFAEINCIKKQINDLRSELEFLKSYICKENLFL